MMRLTSRPLTSQTECDWLRVCAPAVLAAKHAARYPCAESNHSRMSSAIRMLARLRRKSSSPMRKVVIASLRTSLST